MFRSSALGIGRDREAIGIVHLFDPSVAHKDGLSMNHPIAVHRHSIYTNLVARKKMLEHGEEMKVRGS
jgi:hypothetical protein